MKLWTQFKHVDEGQMALFLTDAIIKLIDYKGILTDGYKYCIIFPTRDFEFGYLSISLFDSLYLGEFGTNMGILITSLLE